MSAQEILQSPVFSERFDTPHRSPVLAPVIRKRKAELLTLVCLALIVIIPFVILVVAGVPSSHDDTGRASTPAAVHTSATSQAPPAGP